MIFDRLTWVGFMIVALGWALLFSTPQLVEALASLTGHSMNIAYINMPTIALCTVLTGFGIAILGALQTGFGALNKFFGSVLERTAKSGAIALTNRPEQPKKIIERGWLKDRAYVLFLDGSVEIETMLGRRLFQSLQDAQEFIA
jgi:prepilin-type processing-associated H-X9-DG protein